MSVQKYVCIPGKNALTERQNHGKSVTFQSPCPTVVLEVRPGDKLARNSCVSRLDLNLYFFVLFVNCLLQ